MILYIQLCTQPDLVFFFNDTATTEIYTLSLHDALPISDDEVAQDAATERGEHGQHHDPDDVEALVYRHQGAGRGEGVDRKSTRLNSSHANISYAVFCLKKKKNQPNDIHKIAE